MVHAVNPALIQPLHKQHCMDGARLEVGNHRAQGLQGRRGTASGLTRRMAARAATACWLGAQLRRCLMLDGECRGMCIQAGNSKGGLRCGEASGSMQSRSAHEERRAALMWSARAM